MPCQSRAGDAEGHDTNEVCPTSFRARNAKTKTRLGWSLPRDQAGTDGGYTFGRGAPSRRIPPRMNAGTMRKNPP